MLLFIFFFTLLFCRFSGCKSKDSSEDLYYTKHIYAGADKYLSLFPLIARNNDIILFGTTYWWRKTCTNDLSLVRLSPQSEILWGYGYGRDIASGSADDLNTKVSRVGELQMGNIVVASHGTVNPSNANDDVYYEVFSKNGSLITAKRCDRTHNGVDQLFGLSVVNDSVILTLQSKYIPHDGYWTSYHLILDELGVIRNIYRMWRGYTGGADGHVYPRDFDCLESLSICYEVGIYYPSVYYGYLVKFKFNPDTYELELLDGFKKEFDRFWVGRLKALRNGDALVAGIEKDTTKFHIFRVNGEDATRTWIRVLTGQSLNSFYSTLRELDDGSLLISINNINVIYYYRLDGSDGSLIETFMLDPHDKDNHNIEALYLLNDGSGQYLAVGYPESTVVLSKGDLMNASSPFRCDNVKLLENPEEGTVDFSASHNYDRWNDWTINDYQLANADFVCSDLEFKFLSFQGPSGKMTEVGEPSVIEKEENEGSFPEQFSHYECYKHRTWCYGVTRVNYTYVCSGHGECISYNNCSCSEDYFDSNCKQFYCYDIAWYDPRVCSGENGTCTSVNNCTCNSGYFGKKCEKWECDQILHNDTKNVCRGYGICVSPENCICDEHYNSSIYCDWRCGEYLHVGEEDQVCENHGNCVSFNNCSCETDYYGEECEYHCCFLIKEHDPLVCGTHGSCIRKDQCQCFLGYSSSDLLSGDGQCDRYFCGDYYKDEKEVCSQHGTCIGHKNCECVEGYSGGYCEEFKCGKKDHQDSGVCSGQGTCVESNKCECNRGYDGDECQINTYLTTGFAPSASVSGVFVATSLLCILGCLICCCCCCCFFIICCIFSCLAFLLLRQGKKMRKFGKLENFDLILREQELDKDTSVAHLRINSHLFEIDFDEIKIDSIIGEGGSNSVVYSATFHNEKIAFKCFKTRLICQSQDHFSEFEREVEVMSSVNHPSLVQFFGASLNPPRVGILMEFCCNGEVLDFIIKYDRKSKNDDEEEVYESYYPLVERIRILKEIINGMKYLHSRNIIHRDLKCENVLLDSSEKSKIVDFGISRFVSDVDDQNKTKRVGTNFFMAPEMVNGFDYDDRVDVFSFSIMIWMIISSNSQPYGKDDGYNIEVQVSQNPNFRPSVGEFEKSLKKLLNDVHENEENVVNNYQWLVEMMKKCWRDSYHERYRFVDIAKIFEEECSK